MCNFLELPSLSDIREAVKSNQVPGKSPNGILLDVISGVDPCHERRLAHYTPQDNGLVLRAFTPSGCTSLGEIRLCGGVDVLCPTQTEEP